MSLASFAMWLHSESKPKLAMPMKGVPSTSATSTSRSAPWTAMRAASAGSLGMPSTRAKSLPRPPGTIASALSVPFRAPARGRRSPSPPSATTLSPASTARPASSKAWSMLRVVTVRCSAPSESSVAWTVGSALSALPPAAAGFTSSAKRRAPAGGRAPRPPPGGRRCFARPPRRGLAALGAAQVWSEVDLLDLRPAHELVTQQALGVRLLEVVRVEREQHVLLDAVPTRLVRHALGGHEQLSRARQPVQLEQPETVGEQAVTVAEEDVEAAERGALHRPSHGCPEALHRAARVEVIHEQVEQVLGVRVALRAAHAGLEQVRIADDRAVVPERVAAQAERMRVLGRELAHGGPTHVHVEDAAAGVGNPVELIVRVGGLGELHELGLRALGALVHRHAPAGVVVLRLPDQRVLRLEQLVPDRDRLGGYPARQP